MGERQKYKDRMEIPVDIIPDILLRLPTKDFVRSSCVCKQWRSIVADPSFRKLHVTHHHAAAASSEPEVLLVTETREPGRSDEASVFNLSSAKALCRIAIPSGYRLAGVCNDLLCFALDHDQAPVVVCNPITGETLRLPKAPPLPAGDQLSHIFVLGFSPATEEYKMFRLSLRRRHTSGDETNYLAVYTLGAGGGWRQRSYRSRFHPVISPAPVHIDGNIFVPSADFADKGARAARMLVLDVATETPRWYRIPYNFDDYHDGLHEVLSDVFGLLADGFDLNGQMCLVVDVAFYYSDQFRLKIQFWVMKPPGELEGKDDDEELYWDLRYSFFLDHPFSLPTLREPRGAWIDQAQTLCFRIGSSVYKYDTRGYSSSSNVDPPLFERRLDLPDVPGPRYPSLSSHRLEFCRWGICAGYRPSLLSPGIFALPPSQDGKGKKRAQFERTLTRALMELDEHTDDSHHPKTKRRRNNHSSNTPFFLDDEFEHT